MMTTVLPGQPFTQSSWDCQRETGAETAQAAKPFAERFTVMTLTAECVLTSESMVDSRGTIFRQRCVVLLISSIFLAVQINNECKRGFSISETSRRFFGLFLQLTAE
ncbi:MAG: hypothetical protein WB992_23430 [Bryobacteraceae bacterium]